MRPSTSSPPEQHLMRVYFNSDMTVVFLKPGGDDTSQKNWEKGNVYHCVASPLLSTTISVCEVRRPVTERVTINVTDPKPV